jgi:hypothetical protein
LCRPAGESAASTVRISTRFLRISIHGEIGI